MEIYCAEGKFVLAVKGGNFYSLESSPAAIISTTIPVPIRKWCVARIKDITFVANEEWTVETEFREYLCDERKVYILEFNYSRSKPRYSTGHAEFIVEEEFVKDKIHKLRKTNWVSEYTWDPTSPTWKQVHRKLVYRKACQY